MQDMQDILEALKKKKSFSDVLVTEFAPPEKMADKIARTQEIKTTQLRKVFTAIKNMEIKVKDSNGDDAFNDPALFMMVPHLAYAKARKFVSDDFYNLIKIIVGDGTSGKIHKVKDFRRFAEFMTAIVAYQKFHNSKKEG